MLCKSYHIAQLNRQSLAAFTYKEKCYPTSTNTGGDGTEITIINSNNPKDNGLEPAQLTMTRLILFNKPFGVLSQFTDTKNTNSPRATLSEYIDLPGIYPAGRLDRDSEGLLLLTNNGRLQAKLSNPRFKTPKTYLVQVEGLPDETAVKALQQGITLKDGPTRPAQVQRIEAPDLWPRTPPVRFRKSVPDCWLEITITEGRNRQVRRMTSHIGHPTLRLVRCKIGPYSLNDLAPKEWREILPIW